ncbi:MAG: T9SS type A sorting domain-containing protein [Chitinophagaceae bacterium]
MKTFISASFRRVKTLFVLMVIVLAGYQSFAQAPANDLCINASPLTAAVTCNAVAGTLSDATVSIPTLTGCGTTGADVWYTFVAQSAYPNITLSNPGASLTGTNARIQLFSGSCASLTQLGCISGTFLSTASVYPAGLITGNTYYIRIYSATVAPTGGAAWDFSICVTDPPANDLCSNALLLASATSCTPTAGTLNNAAVSIPAIAGCGTTGGDVWYTFVAQSVYPSITLGSLGSSLAGTNARIQLLSGACGSLTALGCVSNSVFNTAAAYPTGLTPGNTYYIRIYSNTLAPTSAATAWDFSICITDPPINDLCTNATALVSANTCSAVPGTLNYAAVSVPTIATTCGTAGADAWYTFVAQSVYPSITLSNLGSSLTGTNARIQLFSGTCGTLSSLACVATSTFNTAAAYPAGLTPGDTYYIRIYSNAAAPASATTAWDFSICVTDPPTNDLCTDATVLVSNNICSNTSGTLNSAAVSVPAITTTCGTAGGDVWYSFVAQSAYPTITLSSMGININGNARIQIFSGSCASMTSLACVSAASFNTSISYPAGLTPGNTYFVRIYSNTLAPASVTGGWDFSICITDPPVNDNCANAIALTSASVCSNIAGTMGSATYFASGAVACSGTDRYDVWYTFIAQRTNPTITISSAGAGFNTPRIQVLSGTCGSFISTGCNGSTYTPTGLTIGATYYVRVYSTNNPIPNINADFNICITDPALPANDDCAGATVITSAPACSSTAGTLLNATATTGVPGNCGDANSPDVWYSFVANTPFPSITLGSLGAQFAAAGPRVQILSGTCGSFTSLACTNTTSFNTFLPSGRTGLTIGNTYYIRVYTNTAIMSGANWNFNICVTEPAAPAIDYGRSYVNITKGSNGGTIEPGDELEMRATMSVRSNSAYGVSFTGAIPANTTYVPGTLRILTNEGKIYKQWTDAADGDPATISGSAITVNLGSSADQLLGGVMKSSDRPVAGSTCLNIVSFRVIVNAIAFGTPLSVGGGNISYYNPSSATGPINITFPDVTAIVYKNYGICTNTIGSNGILSEYGGTFGSGTQKDRDSSLNIPTNYQYKVFTSGAPGDYFYGMSNNTSTGTGPANYSIDPNDPVAAHRVFAVWDIIGDHTGAANPLAGNLPTDVNNGFSGGYMAVINASYRTDTAFLDTVRNLCPNTSYEYSAWFRNICRRCGVDSVGTQALNPGYLPTGPGDSSGVHPNLTFNINGFDYYTTGDMGYTGQWVKKGFTYRTGPSETQMIINIRNNAPGGGGNDWAIDDIGVASCTPILEVNPADPLLKVCYADGASISAKVKSYFDNYTYYIWEKSTDGGVSFTSTAYTSAGTIAPVFNGSEYEYTATGPSFIGDSTTHNNVFRLRVASSAGNLADPSCSFIAARTVKVYVNNCMWLLKTDFVNTTGSIHNNLSEIQWTTVNGNGKEYYEVEKSTDGSSFTKIGKVNSHVLTGNSVYHFTDPTAIAGMQYYRIKLVEENGFKYSKTILLNTGKANFSVQNLVNPFANTISCNVVLPADGDVRTTIFDMYGRAVKTYRQSTIAGVSPLQIRDLGSLSAGTYFLKIEWQNESIIKKVIKSK